MKKNKQMTTKHEKLLIVQRFKTDADLYLFIAVPTVVPTKSDGDINFCLQFFSKR